MFIQIFSLSLAILKYSKLRHDYAHSNKKYLHQLTFIREVGLLFAMFSMYNVIWVIFIAKICSTENHCWNRMLKNERQYSGLIQMEFST